LLAPLVLHPSAQLLPQNAAVDPAHRQRSYAVRVDWGLDGAKAIAEGANVAVVIDVLSFTTTVSVALDLGTAVLPYRWGQASADAFAQEQDAVLALGRSTAGPGQISLSPATLRATPAPARLVLPSPNGSTICWHLAATTPVCLAASLRNATAVSDWLASHYKPRTTTIAIVAAGERWPGEGLRPAIEDLWGAGSS
jgi:2-phosphosulfolactate phosphatase